MRRALPPVSPAAVIALVAALSSCVEGGPPSAAAPSWEATPELRIGSVDDPETALTYPRVIVVGPGDRIYSAHTQESTILVHDPDGRRVARIGRRGDGPGEFRILGAIGFLGDTLWAFDVGMSRVSYFTPAGALLGTTTVPFSMRPDPGKTPPPRPVGLLTDDRVLGMELPFSREVAAGTLTEVATVAMDTAGSVLDTLYMQPVSIWAITDPADPGSYGAYQPQPFADEPLFAHSPRQPAYVVVHRRVEGDESTTLRVSRITFAGDTVYDHTFSYDPVPIDPAYADSLVSRFAGHSATSRLGNGPALAKATQWARENLYLPAHWPPVEKAVVGLDETV